MGNRKVVYLDEAIDAVCMEWCNVKHQDCKHPFDDEKDDYYWCDGCETVLRTLPDLPSAQPEQRCVNCGRTVNNGGWYKDGRTRCPIEEHYALPKDGYCHLWEKTKVWEDDYVKRPEEGKKDG